MNTKRVRELLNESWEAQNAGQREMAFEKLLRAVGVLMLELENEHARTAPVLNALVAELPEVGP